MVNEGNAVGDELRQEIDRAIGARLVVDQTVGYVDGPRMADAVMAVVDPLVEQLRQAEVSRDAYRDERDATRRERDTALAEVKRLNALMDWYNKAGTIELASHDRAMNERDARIAEVTSELATLRASAFVLPEPVQRLVDWHLSVAGTNVARMPRQSEVREAMESWRPATVEAAPTERVDTEWCVFYGGTDPSNSAGIERYDDEADATEKVPLYWQWQPTGVAKRTVRRGPWEITQAAGVCGTGTEAGNG